MVDAANVFDSSYWKLREVTLTYTLPKGLLNNAIQDISITAFARNLFTWGLAWDIDLKQHPMQVEMFKGWKEVLFLQRELLDLIFNSNFN